MKFTKRISGTRWNLLKSRLKRAIRTITSKSRSTSVQTKLFGFTAARRPRMITRSRHSVLKNKRRIRLTNTQITKVVEQSTSFNYAQLDLFSILPEPIKIRAKFTDQDKLRIKRLAKRKKRATVKANNLQYKMPLASAKTLRKLTFNTKIHELNSNDIQWTEIGIRKLHYILLTQSISTLKELAEDNSSKAAEIWAWVEKTGHDEDFSFDTCVAIAGEFDIEYANMDPELLRNSLQRILLKQYRAEFPHAKLLKEGILNAETGHQDAIEWVISDSDAPLSFNDCCKALGFNPDKAREEIYIDPIDLLQIA